MRRKLFRPCNDTAQHLLNLLRNTEDCIMQGVVGNGILVAENGDVLRMAPSLVRKKAQQVGVG